MHLYQSNINLKLDIPYLLPFPYINARKVTRLLRGWQNISRDVKFRSPITST